VGGASDVWDRFFKKTEADECGRMLRKTENVLFGSGSRAVRKRSGLSTPMWIEHRRTEGAKIVGARSTCVLPGAQSRRIGRVEIGFTPRWTAGEERG
jgi:hypothetical protein